jgi:hypothetical protein
MKQTNLNERAVQRLQQLQLQRTGPDGKTDPLHVLVDGSYTNRKVLKRLPPNTVLIGRIRKDAHLNFLPEEQPGRGRKRVYGKEAPTPEELRVDSTVPYQQISAYAAGEQRIFKVKTLAPLRWKSAGKELDLRLVVIAPVPYLKKIGSKRLYRQPAYLICTDPTLSLQSIVQEYIWRWDIEQTHRDEKTLLGVGQAQVRNPNSVHCVPASAVAAYAMLQLAAIQAFGWDGQPHNLPPPKWRDPNKKKRASTLDLINEIRRELWASAIRPSHLTHFVNPQSSHTNPLKLMPSLCNAIFYETA